MRLSIRWRLTLWNLLTLAVVLLGFGALVYELLEHALYQKVDRSLLAELEELHHKPSINLSYWIKEAKEHENISCLVYDAGGVLVERTEELPEASAASLPPPAGDERRLFDVVLPILGRQRALASTAQLAGRPLQIVLFASLEEVDWELAQLLRVLGTSVPLALAVAGVFSYLLARKALTPVKRLHRLAAEITIDRLDHRLPVGNAGDEVGQLSQTINAMIGRLEQSVAEIRRFTADASHELRTPLTAIRTEAEVALSKPMDAADYHQLLGSILEECERLTGLTEQLLTLAREDAGLVRADAEPVEVGALLEDVVKTMRPLAEAKGLGLRLEGRAEGVVCGAASRLRQVFLNLLDNAIKYTPRGAVEVRCEQAGGEVWISVRDDGIGIPPEHLSRVFDRFYRVDKARSRELGGTGLGLSIAKTIVTAHGGQIDLTSTPGRGTTCTVMLPVEGKT
jgi:heavy metal sensor kinase